MPSTASHSNSFEINFLNWDYLLHGNERQRLAHANLQALDLAVVLRTYGPIVLAGTIPLNIDIPGQSDLDVLCGLSSTDDFTSFGTLVQQHYGHFPNFRLYVQTSETQKDDPEKKEEKQYIVANFDGPHFEVEIFAQAHVPVTQQYAYRHMVIEYRLLQEHGEPLRRKIVELKQSGIKTEPAFCQALGLLEKDDDDPYEALLRLE